MWEISTMLKYSSCFISSQKIYRRINFSLNPKFLSSLSPSSPPSTSEDEFPFISLRQLNFMCNEFLQHNEFISKLERYEGQDERIYREIVSSACEKAYDYNYPLRESITENSPYKFINHQFFHNIDHRNAMKVIGKDGFLRLESSIARGGMQIPYHISCLARVPFAAANIGLSGYYITNTQAAARLLDYYPNIHSKESLIADMINGTSHGVVCLSEKHSNLSLTDVRCRADFFAKDRTFRVRGTKTCVYGGAHEFGDNIFYIVSARLPHSSDGVDGISLFIVPKYVRPFLTFQEVAAQGQLFDTSFAPNDIVVKNAYNIGKSACTYVDIEFGHTSQLGALAFLIGHENEGVGGIRQHILYNNVQLGYNAISCGLSAYYHSLSFASNPQPLDTIKDIPYSLYTSIKEEAPPLPDDGVTYLPTRASIPVVDAEEQQRLQELLRNEDQKTLIPDGKHVKRPLLSRPDIKSLLLSQKAHLEGGLSLCVYTTHLLDILENDENKVFNYVELFMLYEFLSPIVKYYCTKYSLQSVHNAKEIYAGIGVVDGNIAQDLIRDCEIFCQDGFNNTLHSLDFLNHRLVANNGRGYLILQKYIQQTIDGAKNESDEFHDCVSIISSTLAAHVEITTQLLAEKSKNTNASEGSMNLLANSKEYMDLTGHLVVSWMWLQQGMIAYQKLSSPSTELSEKDRHFYYGKMCTLDYYCHYELIKMKGLIEFLKTNPQLNNSFEAEWF